MTKEEKMITRLQKSLAALRKFRKWSAQQLGDRVGVTKQTISNIEKSRTPMSKMVYASIRLAFQASLYEMTEFDAAWFSYMLETTTDPTTNDELIQDLSAAMIVAAAMTKTKAYNAARIIERMVDGTTNAVSNHRIKYTSDPDGLSWYYEMMGIDHTPTVSEPAVAEVSQSKSTPMKKQKSRRIETYDSSQSYVTPNLVVMSEFARRAGITVGVLRTKIANGDIPIVKVDEHPNWIYIDTKYIDTAKPALIDKDDYITVTEFANRFHCNNSAVSGFIGTGSLAAKKISEGVSNFWLISKAFIDRLTGEEYSLSEFYAVKAIARDYNVNYVKLGDAVVAKRIPGVQLVDASGYVHKFIPKDALNDKKYIHVIESCK